MCVFEYVILLSIYFPSRSSFFEKKQKFTEKVPNLSDFIETPLKIFLIYIKRQLFSHFNTRSALSFSLVFVAHARNASRVPTSSVNRGSSNRDSGGEEAPSKFPFPHLLKWSRRRLLRPRSRRSIRVQHRHQCSRRRQRSIHRGTDRRRLLF